MSKMNANTDVDCNKKRKIKVEPESLDSFWTNIQPDKKIKVEIANDVSCDDKDKIQLEKEDLLKLVEKDFGKEVYETVLL